MWGLGWCRYKGSLQIYYCIKFIIMERRGIFFASLYMCVFLPTVFGQLQTAEKQAILDLHNELRGTAGGANIVQSVSIYIYTLCIHRPASVG